MNSSRFMRSWLSVLAAVALPSGAAAQLHPERGAAGALPTFSAPASCPDAASWVEEVVSRVELAARERVRRELPSLVESLEVRAGGKRASLRLRGAAARWVVGEDCGEVLTGAALVAAIALSSALEPGAGVEPSPGSAPAPSNTPAPAEPPAPVKVSAPKESEAPELPSSKRLPVLEGTGDRVDGVAPDRGAIESTAPPAAPPHWAIGAGAGMHTGIAPSPAGLLDAVVELSWSDRSWSVRGRGSLGLAHALVGGRSARFFFMGGAADLCRVAIGTHLGWQWRSCVGFELGQLRAEGDATSALRTAQAGSMWWAAPGVATRLQSPRIYGIRLEAEGGASMPLWHREFEFREPDVSVFETPLVALTARLGLQVPLE